MSTEPDNFTSQVVLGMTAAAAIILSYGWMIVGLLFNLHVALVAPAAAIGIGYAALNVYRMYQVK